MSRLTVWKDGEIKTVDRARSTDLEAGLHYGVGVFEGIRAYETPSGVPAIFRLDAHMNRMEKGAAHLGMTLDRAAMERAMHDLLVANQFSNAYLRPIAWWGGGDLHLDVQSMTRRQMVAALPWSSHLGADAGCRMTVSRVRRNPRSAIPALKLCGAYVNALIAKLEAKKRGFDTALYMDGDRVVEATAENVFFVKNGVVTRVLHPDALPGVTAATVQSLTGAQGRGVEINELREADELFIVGTSAEVTPVTLLDDRILPFGPVTREIRDTYLDIVHGRNPQYAAWLTYCEGFTPAVEAAVGK